MNNEFEGEFSVGTDENPTLLGAITAKGGYPNDLARHCVAAKLNAEMDEASGMDLIDYPFTFDQVIEMCNDGFEFPGLAEDIKNDLATANELGAPNMSQQIDLFDWPL